MTFNSYIFIFAFLPLCLLGYYLLNYFKLYKTGLFFLLGMSLWFYGYFNPKYLLIICGSVIVNYIVYCILHYIAKKNNRHTGRILLNRKLILIAGIVFNFGLLGYFKYQNFFIENLNFILKEDFILKNIMLPLGISFFTFQQVSFIADVYNEKNEAGGVFLIPFLSMQHM